MWIRCLIAFLSLTSAASAHSIPTDIYALREWTGKLSDNKLKAAAPKSLFIADEKAWNTLWKAWRGKEEVAKVDFAKELVLVGVGSGPNIPMMKPQLSDDGDVTIGFAQTLIGGDGFGYRISVIPRKDVVSVRGTSLVAKGVSGTIRIPAKVASFEKRRLEVLLYEYHPFLADVPAKLVDSLKLDGYQHTQGKDTKTTFVVGDKMTKKEDHEYYLTVFILNDGKRTHMGEKDGKNGLCKVLKDEAQTTVKMIVRPVK